jgi:hypothetical protein
MKTVTGAIQTQLDRQYSSEPTIIVKLDGVAYDVINVSQINQQGSSNQIGSISDVTVLINDSSGTFKTLMDTDPLMYKRCTIEKAFNDVAGSIVMIDGAITSPITWFENNRTVEFTVVDRLRSEDVTILPEDEECERQYPPMCFGTVLGVKGVNITCIPESITLDTIKSTSTGKASNAGAHVIVNKGDFRLTNPEQFPTESIIVQVAGVLMAGDIVDGTFIHNEFNKTYGSVAINPRGSRVNDPDYGNPSVFWCSDYTGTQLAGRYVRIRYNISNMYTDESEEEEVDAGVSGAKSVAGQYFSHNRVSQQDKNKCVLENQVMDPFGRPVLLGQGGSSRVSSEHVVEICGQYNLSWPGKLQYSYPSAWSIPPGTPVYLYAKKTGDDWVYINQYLCVNAVPSGSVFGLFGIKDGGLYTIPSSFYTTNLNDTTAYPDQAVTSVTLNKRLSSLSQGWASDDVYAVVESTIGPNVVDVIQHIVTNYTERQDRMPCTVDSSTFTAVKNRNSVKNYPVGFALQSSINASTLLEQICWEAHLGLVIRNGIAYLKDLTEDKVPVSGLTLDMDIVERDTFRLSLSDITDMYTRIDAKWHESYFPTDYERKIVKSKNIEAFERLNLDHDYLIYNVRLCVARSMEFWLERYANTWQIIQFTTFLKGIVLDVYDIVTVSLPFTTAVKGQVIEYNLNNDTESCTLKLWTPISGSGGSAFPSDIFTDEVAPIAGDAFEDYTDIQISTPMPYVPKAIKKKGRSLKTKGTLSENQGDKAYDDVASSMVKRMIVDTVDKKLGIAHCHVPSMGNDATIDPEISSSSMDNVVLADGSNIKVKIPVDLDLLPGTSITAIYGAKHIIQSEA